MRAKRSRYVAVPITMKKLECYRCGHKWWPKDPEKRPMKCPFCSIRTWDKKKEDLSEEKITETEKGTPI